YGWRPNHVTVTSPLGALVSEPSAWWTNPVERPTTAIVQQAGVVWGVGAGVAALDVRADGASVVVRPGEVLTGSGTVLRTSSEQTFLWLEGDVVGLGGGSSTVFLQRMAHSRVRKLTVVRPVGGDTALELKESNGNLVDDVVVQGGTNCLALDRVHWTRFERLTLAAGIEGVDMTNSNDNLFFDVTVASTGDGDNDNDGLEVNGSSRNAFVLLNVVGNED